MNEWVGALDVQGELVRLWKSEAGMRYAAAYEQQMKTLGQVLPNVAAFEVEKLMLSDPVAVAPVIVDLVEAATTDFDPTEKLIAEDLFCSHGFALLPRPLHLVDRHGKICSYRAFSWGCYGRLEGEANSAQFCEAGDADGILLSLYTHVDDPDDYHGTRELAARTSMGIAPSAKWALVHVTPWEFGTYMASSDDLNISGALAMMTQIQVFFRLAQQKITTREPLALPRAQRRDAERRGLPTDVVLITLRHAKERPEREDGEDKAWELTYRHIVRGHWRNQWYPSLGDHRQVYIAPFIKGPPDAELVIKPMRAFNFRR